MGGLTSVGRAPELEKPKKGQWRTIFAVLAFLVLALMLFAIVSSVVVLTIASKLTTTSTTTTTAPTTSSTTSTTITSTLTTSSTTTSSTTSSTTTTTSTTSTTLCGGQVGVYFNLACAGTAPCNEGFILNSNNLCVPVECAPTANSGRDGCGSYALDWCTQNAKYY